jgi:hypothetical protein
LRGAWNLLAVIPGGRTAQRFGDLCAGVTGIKAGAKIPRHDARATLGHRLGMTVWSCVGLQAALFAGCSASRRATLRRTQSARSGSEPSLSLKVTCIGESVRHIDLDALLRMTPFLLGGWERSLRRLQ